MLFNSYIFILLFLPLAIAGYYLCNHFEAYRLGKLYLIGMSLWFYGYFNISYLPIIVLSVLVNFGLYSIIKRAYSIPDIIQNASLDCEKIVRNSNEYSSYTTDNNKITTEMLIAKSGFDKFKKLKYEATNAEKPSFFKIITPENKKLILKFTLITGVILNIGALFYFKYFDFFIENTNALFSTDFVLKYLALPLGISFFTFQQVGFLLDAHRGEALGYDFIDYALFVTFFPQLIAGPIVNHDEMIPQFQDMGLKKPDWERASKGIYRFALGLAKKVLIADVVGRGVAYGYGRFFLDTELEGLSFTEQVRLMADGSGLTTGTLVLVLISYMIQLYFDFSGYCDMASGAALMMNIKLPDNFNSPYKSVSVPDFWKRWHITLTRFLTRYIYIPLGGNRKGKVRTYINIMAVYIISGMWHGAGWTFLLWGTLHGGFLCIERAVGNFYRDIKVKFEHKKVENNCQAALNKSHIMEMLIYHGIKYLLITINLVLFALLLVVFRSESLTQMCAVFTRLCQGSMAVPMEFFRQYNMPEFFYVLKVLGLNADSQIPAIIALGLIVVSMIIAVFFKNTIELERDFKPTVINGVITVVLILWCLVSLSQVSTFLYFDF